MKTIFFMFCIMCAIIILGTSQTINAQPATSNVTNIINEKYGHRNYFDNSTNTVYEIDSTVRVNYESPTTILISGELINSRAQFFNSDLWQAMDLLKSQYGFKLQNVMTSGIGSIGNPTTVYILMSK